MTLSEHIERHLKSMLRQADGRLEIQRSDLAQQFDCAPSQINYVLETRFTTERGYVIESRRGGGGYIRIIKVQTDSYADLLDLICDQIGQQLSQDQAVHYIDRLQDNGVIDPGQASVMRAAVHRKVLALELPLRDQLRARILRSMLLAILRHEGVQ